MPKPLEYCWKKAIVNSLNNVAAAVAEATEQAQQSAAASASTSSTPSTSTAALPSSNLPQLPPPPPPRGNVIIVNRSGNDKPVHEPGNCSSDINSSHGEDGLADLRGTNSPKIYTTLTPAASSSKATSVPTGSNTVLPGYSLPSTSSSLENATPSPETNDKTETNSRNYEDNDIDQRVEILGGKKSSPCFECPHCPKKFKHKSYLNYHLRSHTGERPFKCHLCPKGFLERSKLNRHLHSLHNIKLNRIYEVSDDGSVQEQQNKCGQCQKSFSRMDRLQTHIQMVHENIKPFACSKCDKTFSGRTALKNHEKGHEGVKNFVCILCGKGFLLKKYLDLHMNTTHKKEPKKHGCDRCRKEFHTEKDLKRHQLMHSNAKNWKCSVCQTSFKRKDNLTRHLKLTHDMNQAQISGESGQSSSTESPTKSADEAAKKSVAAPPPQSQSPQQPPNQVSVIKSTHEVMMSISRGQPFI